MGTAAPSAGTRYRRRATSSSGPSGVAARGTRESRTDPALFILLFACELFGWVMLASFCFLSWRVLRSGLLLGLWELGLVTAAVLQVSQRRQLRRHYRAPAELAAAVGDEIARVADLTTSGTGLVSPTALSPGQEMELTVDLPMLNGDTTPTHLSLLVTGCRLDPHEERAWRIGGTVTPRSNQDRVALVEYCHVVASRERLTATGRLMAGTRAESMVPPPEVALRA